MGKKFAVAQAKVTHILRPGKASEKIISGNILADIIDSGKRS
jgi:hypothetical protein